MGRMRVASVASWLLIALAVLVCWPRSGRYFPHAEPCGFTEALGWAVLALAPLGLAVLIAMAL